ncbi:Substrate-specific component FolT of folate ECF transporter [Lactobacillus delbrueckii subsp. bulgaricus]|nr:Substrate-specific component FolT of folate ECF transporter [Lactobacillus delbrueckii subsp. bulgaricus]
MSDLVSSAIFGNLGGFFIGFTLTAALESMIYGFFFYKKPIQIWRVIASVICVTVICNIGLNTLWVSMMYGINFMVALSSRILKEIITPWIQMVVVWFILEGLSRVKLSRKF